MHELKTNKSLRKRREQGLTLIEASMVLALSAVVVAGAIMYFQSASDNNRLKDAQSELGGLQTAIATLYSGTSGYPGLAPAVFNGQSSIPANFIQGTPTNITGFTNPWGGAATLEVVADAGGGNPNAHYSIAFDSVPKGSCAAMAVQPRGGSLISFQIGEHTASAGTAFTAAEAATICGDPVNNTLTWTFK